MNLLLILDTILNPVNIDYNCDQGCSEARETVHKRFLVEMLKVFAEACGQIARPSDDSYFDFWAKRYLYLRMFSREFVKAFQFLSNRQDNPQTEKQD
jgi:hypothetical protein